MAKYCPIINLLFLGLLFIFSVTNASIVYKDPKQATEARVEDLLKRMNLEEKIGQMIQLDREGLSAEIVKSQYIGSILSGGGSAPLLNATAKDWMDMVNGFQKAAMSTRLQIPILYGTDAVHGHNNVYKATIFPHNIGLGVTRFLLFFLLKGIYDFNMSLFFSRLYSYFFINIFIFNLFILLFNPSYSLIHIIIIFFTKHVL